MKKQSLSTSIEIFFLDISFSKKILQILLLHKQITKEYLVFNSKTNETSSLYIKLELQRCVDTSILINPSCETQQLKKHLLWFSLSLSIFISSRAIVKQMYSVKTKSVIIVRRHRRLYIVPLVLGISTSPSLIGLGLINSPLQLRGATCLQAYCPIRFFCVIAQSCFGFV